MQDKNLKLSLPSAFGYSQTLCRHMCTDNCQLLIPIFLLYDGQTNVFQKVMDELALCHLGRDREQCSKLISTL